MIDPADTSGLAFAAVALSTASLAAAVRRGEISVGEMRAIIADAHALVHEQAGFVVDPKAAQAADDFLSAAEALPTRRRFAYRTRLGRAAIAYDRRAGSSPAPRRNGTPAAAPPALLTVSGRAALGLGKIPHDKFHNG